MTPEQFRQTAPATPDNQCAPGRIWSNNTERALRSVTSRERVQVVRLPHCPALPAYTTPGSAGMDLCAAISFRLGVGQIAIIPTGIRIAVPDGYELQIRPCSSLAFRGVIGANSPAAVDQNYRDEIRVMLANISHNMRAITKGDRIAQAVLCPVRQFDWDVVDDLPGTVRVKVLESRRHME
jgi:dUTP diphosphatase